MFDCWICNEDRHDENVSWIEMDSREADEIYVFDHGRALLADNGPERLFSYEGRLPSPELAAHLNSLATFDEWDQRLREVSDIYIKDVVNDVIRLYGLKTAQAIEIANFLIRRKKRLRNLIAEDRETKTVFQSVEEGLFLVHPEDEDSEAS